MVPAVPLFPITVLTQIRLPTFSLFLVARDGVCRPARTPIRSKKKGIVQEIKRMFSSRKIT